MLKKLKEKFKGKIYFKLSPNVSRFSPHYARTENL